MNKQWDDMQQLLKNKESEMWDALQKKDEDAKVSWAQHQD